MHMFKPIRKQHPLIKIINRALIDLPAPKNLSVWWNYGSLLALCLITQILTGIFLAIHYTPHIDLAFSSVAHISRDVNYGWLLRRTHINIASLFFACIYIHVGRGIYYGSFIIIETWNSGVILLVLTIATAFIGYVLPWGQISFWGATVITNIFSAIPYIGTILVEWLWGGFAIDNATLNRFFSLHFVLPFIILAIFIIHVLFLHQTGSNNPLGLKSSHSRIKFHPYYSTKDIVGIVIISLTLIVVVMFFPNILADPENYIPANPLTTPIHIKPEWYFLWAYAILRSIPNKLGGVIALLVSVLILFVIPLTKIKSSVFLPINQSLFWFFIITVTTLTWIGGCPVEAPYEIIGQVFTIAYFIFYIVAPFQANNWVKVLIS